MIGDERQRKGEEMEKQYAQVIIDISHEKVDRPFCYKIPQHLKEKVEIGSSVILPPFF